MIGDPNSSPFWPADSPTVIAHVNLLQGIISRLAGNSASCKTWCIALVSAFLSLAGATHLPGIVSFALVPVVVFAFMDAMYLNQERAYRALYTAKVNAIRQRTYVISDAFDASAPVQFSGIWSALASWSICPVYLTLIVAYFVVLWTGWLSLLILPAK